jgi:hypothetical protein
MSRYSADAPTKQGCEIQFRLYITKCDVER